MSAGWNIRPAFSIASCAESVEEMRLTMRRIFRKLSLYITFSEVLGVPADNEQNPVFSDIRDRKADGIGVLPMTRFEIFNEVLFESYCKKSVSNAIKKEREKKAARAQLELSFSALTDAVLYVLSTQNDGTDQPEKPCQIFNVQGMSIPIYHEKLSQALSHLMPKDREIILLYFFKGLKDARVAPLVHMSRPTVSRRRKAAMKRLRELMEDST